MTSLRGGRACDGQQERRDQEDGRIGLLLGTNRGDDCRHARLLRQPQGSELLAGNDEVRRRYAKKTTGCGSRCTEKRQPGQHDY